MGSLFMERGGQMFEFFTVQPVATNMERSKTTIMNHYEKSEPIVSIVAYQYCVEKIIVENLVCNKRLPILHSFR